MTVVGMVGPASDCTGIIIIYPARSVKGIRGIEQNFGRGSKKIHYSPTGAVSPSGKFHKNPSFCPGNLSLLSP